MGIFDRIMEWLGGTGAGGDNALYYYIKCDHCDEVVRLRIGRGSDLTQEFGRRGRQHQRLQREQGSGRVKVLSPEIGLADLQQVVA